MQVVLDNSSRPGILLSPLLKKHGRKSLEQAVVYRILTDDAFAEKAVVALFSKQEPKEQESKRTFVLNHQGLSAADAGTFSAMAECLLAGHRLSAKELAVCRQRSSTGMPRLGKYRRQLAGIFREDLLPSTGAESDSLGTEAGYGVVQ